MPNNKYTVTNPVVLRRILNNIKVPQAIAMDAVRVMLNDTGDKYFMYYERHMLIIKRNGLTPVAGADAATEWVGRLVGDQVKRGNILAAAVFEPNKVGDHKEFHHLAKAIVAMNICIPTDVPLNGFDMIECWGDDNEPETYHLTRNGFTDLHVWYDTLVPSSSKFAKEWVQKYAQEYYVGKFKSVQDDCMLPVVGFPMGPEDFKNG